MEKISRLLMIIFLVVGMLATALILHEVYHLVTLHESPTGVCIGTCDVSQENISGKSQEHAFAAVYWNVTNQTYWNNIDFYKNEQHAWWFGATITLLLMFIMIKFKGKS